MQANFEFSKNELNILKNISQMIQDLINVNSKNSQKESFKPKNDEYNYHRTKSKDLKKGFNFISNSKADPKNEILNKKFSIDPGLYSTNKYLSTKDNSYFSCSNCKSQKGKMTTKLYGELSSNEIITEKFMNLFLSKKISKEEAVEILQQIKINLRIPYNAKKAKKNLEKLVENVLNYYQNAYDEKFFTENFISIVNNNLKNKKLDYNFKAKYLSFKEIFCQLVDKISSISNDLGKQIRYIVDIKINRAKFEKLLLNKISKEISIFLNQLNKKLSSSQFNNYLNYQSI
jgi:hypothetical protein